MFKKLLLSFIVLNFVFSPAFAIIADDSIDADIKKTYKTGIIEDNLLPKLPQSQPTNNDYSTQNIEETVFSTPKNIQPASQTTSYFNKEYKEISIKKGTKFRVRGQNYLSDKTPAGSKISFVSIYPETSRYVTIPAGSLFKGTIVDSHTPQLFGNGGLIKLKVDQIYYKGQPYPIKASISIINYKHVFYSSAKGKRTYAKSMASLTKPGAKFMKRMCKVSGSLTNGPEILLSPIPIASGVVFYTVNAALSPVLAIFSTGKSISIPNGTYYEIKLNEDALIRI